MSPGFENANEGTTGLVVALVGVFCVWTGPPGFENANEGTTGVAAGEDTGFELSLVTVILTVIQTVSETNILSVI